jgi:hypothetical protein
VFRAVEDKPVFIRADRSSSSIPQAQAQAVFYVLEMLEFVLGQLREANCKSKLLGAGGGSTRRLASAILEH